MASRNPSPRNNGNFLTIAVALALIIGLGYMKLFPEEPVVANQEETTIRKTDDSEEIEEDSYPDIEAVVVGSLPDDIVAITEQSRVIEVYGTDTSYVPPNWIRNAVPMSVPKGMKKIVIIIDDLGENRTLTEETIKLPSPLTMAFLPYPKGVSEYADQARSRGHEIMVHMPMEAMSTDLDDHDYVLSTQMDMEQFNSTLEKNLDSFSGYVGVNNHMGSRLTQNPDYMAALMEHLERNGLLFVDSRTIHTSVAGDMAELYNIPFEERDIFLDHDESRESVDAALLEVERIAREQGVAVAIGHPKRNTIDALRDWIPTLPQKNLIVVPVSSVVRTGVFSDSDTLKTSR